jgi:hypothetical protein
MKFSIYTSAFNLIKNSFNYKISIKRFCDFADEVVVCVNTSIDNTYEELILLKSIYNNLVVIESDFSYSDPLLDGKIKNAALQSTSNEIKIGLDMDEYIPLWQKPMWDDLAFMLKNHEVDCFMIPSINLYKDKDHYFSISPKWYLHKDGLFRGAAKYAINIDGTVNTNYSDTCELIYSNGCIVNNASTICDIESLRENNLPFVVHEGYLDLDARLIRNKNFWSDHWLIESGGKQPPHKIHKSHEDFQESYLEHNLNIL